MDPVSLIVVALVNGIMAGLHSASHQMVKDAYIAFRNKIINTYRKVSIDKLEENPLSKARQGLVEEELRNAGADKDDEIIFCAQRLLDLIEGQDRSSKQSNNPVGGTTEEVIEREERNLGYQAIGQIIDSHLQRVLYVRANFSLNDQDLLSKNIVRSHTIPNHLRTDIGQLHTQIRGIIQQIAVRIEERKYKTAEDAINNMHLAFSDRQRAHQLVQADKRVHVSYQGLKTTVEFFAELNQLIIEKIQNAASPQSETNLLLGNAILVYELTDYVISYLENFAVYGVEEISILHEETKQRIADLRRQQHSLEQQAQSESVEQSVRDQIVEDIKTRERSIALLEQEWTNYVEMIASLRSEIGKVHNKVPTLEVIRENAKVQINLIQAVAMLQILKQSIGTMRATIITLGNIKLASLSPNRVRRLLGIN